MNGEHINARLILPRVLLRWPAQQALLTALQLIHPPHWRWTQWCLSAPASPVWLSLVSAFFAACARSPLFLYPWFDWTCKSHLFIEITFIYFFPQRIPSCFKKGLSSISALLHRFMNMEIGPFLHLYCFPAAGTSTHWKKTKKHWWKTRNKHEILGEISWW